MEFEVYTQDGLRSKGTKKFETLEELMDFIKLHDRYNVIVNVGKIYVNNIGDEDLF